MPCTRTSRLTLEVEVDPLAPLARLERNRLSVDVDRRRSSPARFQWIVIGSRTSSRACSSAMRRAVARRSSAAPCARIASICCRTIGFGGPIELGLRDVAVEHQALEDAAELGVAFLVAAQIGREVVERAHRAADVGQRQAGEQLAVRHVFGRKRHRHGQHARSARRRVPAVTQNDVPPRIDVELRLRDRDVVEQERRRLARAPCRGRAGRSSCRGPGSRRCCACRRSRRSRTTPTPSAIPASASSPSGYTPPWLRQLRDVRQLALVHPSLDEMRIHAVEAEDDELLRSTSMARAGRRVGAGKKTTLATSATAMALKRTNSFHGIGRL